MEIVVNWFHDLKLNNFDCTLIDLFINIYYNRHFTYFENICYELMESVISNAQAHCRTIITIIKLTKSIVS